MFSKEHIAKVVVDNIVESLYERGVFDRVWHQLSRGEQREVKREMKKAVVKALPLIRGIDIR